MRRRLLTLVVPLVLAVAGCGGDDEEESERPQGTTPETTAQTTTEPTEAPAGEPDSPTFERVRKLALKEIGRCPKEKSDEYISRAGQRARGIQQFTALYCDEVPSLLYVRYDDQAALEKDIEVTAAQAKIPFFVNANVLVNPLAILDERVQRDVVEAIREDCGCGEIREPAK